LGFVEVFKKMMVSEPKKTEQGFVLDVFYNEGEYYFTSQSFSTLKDAKRWGKDWCYWANNVSTVEVLGSGLTFDTHML
jgi:hypothetical protein